MTAQTPAEVAAAAARVAAEWTPDTIAEAKAYVLPLTVSQWRPVVDQIEALLAERERLRGLVAAAHVSPRPYIGERWPMGMILQCECGETLAEYGPGTATPKRIEDLVRTHAAHVADVLEGRA